MSELSAITKALWKRLFPVSLNSSLLALILFFPSCSTFHRSADSDTVTDSIPDVDITAEAMAWADSVTMHLSLQRRVAQLFMPAVYTTADNPNLTAIADYADRMGAGGIILLKGDIPAAAAIADTINALAPYGMFVAVDAENGLAMRFKDAPKFMWNSQISQNADEQELYDYGQELARECRAVGINMVLGPVLDVLPAGGPMPKESMRSFGSDPERVARIGVAYARGLEDGGVLSVAKHFPGHGSARGDSHKRLAEVGAPKASLLARDLLPFRRYSEAALSGVMAGHIYAEALDSIKRPASFSPAILTNLLRNELHFSGLVLTDALTMQGAGGYTALDAIRAGADIIIAPVHTERSIADVRDAVERGEIDESIINDRCRRILFYKYIKGIAPGTEFHSHISAPASTLHSLLRRDADAVKARL